jgi:phosphoribosylanthranilate isomerase
LVKIDGLRQTKHAVAAATAGADLIGFIFAPARRQVTAEVAAEAIAAAREAAGSRPVATVGVFVDASATEINAVVREAGLNLVQLHGDEPPALLPEIVCPVIKAVRPRSGTSAAQVAELFESYAAMANAPVLFVVDGHAPGVAGGAGVRADWALALRLAAAWPVMLAGGLDPGNVSEAIRSVRPAGVDVSSGVETAGVKDPTKIAAFVVAARRALTGISPATP